MKPSCALKIALASVVCTAATAQSALAGSEPKNTLPFTRPVAGHGENVVAGHLSGELWVGLDVNPILTYLHRGLTPPYALSTDGRSHPTRP